MAIIDCYAKFNVAIIVVMIIIVFKEIKEKIRVKKEDHIKVVVEGNVVQKEEFVQVSGGGNFVVATVIVALQR